MGWFNHQLENLVFVGEMKRSNLTTCAYVSDGLKLETTDFSGKMVQLAKLATGLICVFFSSTYLANG